MKRPKKVSLLERVACNYCGYTFAKVCLFNGICDDCSTYGRVGNYDITVNDYRTIKRQQNGVCAICQKDAYLMIDHDHKTSRVRGLLCRECNNGLGIFKDSTEALVRAAEYLVNARKLALETDLKDFDTYLRCKPKSPQIEA